MNLFHWLSRNTLDTKKLKKYLTFPLRISSSLLRDSNSFILAFILEMICDLESFSGESKPPNLISFLEKLYICFKCQNFIKLIIIRHILKILLMFFIDDLIKLNAIHE